MAEGKDQNDGTGTEGIQDQNQSDPLTSIKSEFSRKTQKLAEDNQKLSQQLNEITQLLQKQTGPSKPANSSATEEDDLEDLAYRDPKGYARKVREQATQEATRVVSQQLNQQQQSQAVLNQLVADYPELSDASNELTVKAVEIYKNLSDDEKRSPSAYKIAVRDAAADLGVLPKSKRKSTSGDDNFSFGGSSSSSGNAPSRSKSGGDLDQRTLAFAEMVGLNIKDKKVVDRLKQRSQRKSWSKYE
jgi:hypothetical protein